MSIKKIGKKHAEVGEGLINVVGDKLVGINVEPTHHRMMTNCCGSRKTKRQGD